MEQYTCLVCGYVYNPVHGDLDQGIEPGTSFDDLPDDWKCPVCASPVMDFQEIASNGDPIIEVKEEIVDDEEIPTKDEE
jgi:rubredoxin